MPDLGNTSVFSQTDGSNASGTMPSWSGAAAPSTIDDAGRALQGAVTREWNWRSYTITATGTADVKVLTYSVAPAAYYNGQRFAFIANTTNTGSATLNVNSLGAKTIKKDVSGTLTALSASDMTAGMFVEVAYNSSDNSFVWVNSKTSLPQSLGTGDSPQFAGVNVGNASDTTITRISAGVIAVEGNHVPSPASTAQGDVLYHNGTTWARLGAGTSGQYLKTLGTGANPAWANTGPTSASVQNSTSGTIVEFTGIPSWVKRITMMLNGVSTSGTSIVQVQLGSTTYTTSGYAGIAAAAQGGGTTAVSSFTTGAGLGTDSGATYTRHGQIVIANLTGNSWSIMGVGGDPTTTRVFYSASTVALSGVLDRVRLTTVNGTDTFDAGTVNIMYE